VEKSFGKLLSGDSWSGKRRLAQPVSKEFVVFDGVERETDVHMCLNFGKR
jgi:hypothetical protein